MSKGNIHLFLLRKSLIICADLDCFQYSRTRKLVQVFDDLSDAICRVADLCEFIRIMHREAEFCYAAEDACIVMSGIVEK